MADPAGAGGILDPVRFDAIVQRGNAALNARDIPELRRAIGEIYAVLTPAAAARHRQCPERVRN